MNEQQVLQEFIDAEAILKGHFILSSGLHSDTYLQCARVLMDPKRGERLCRALADKVRKKFKKTIDMVFSPAMGGVVVGYEMARQLDVPSIFCERVDGSFQIRRGFSIPKGARILIVEDVVTTGKSSIEAMDCAKKAGGIVVAEACLIHRAKENPLPVPLMSLAQLDVKSYEADKLPPSLAAIPGIKPGSRWINS